MGKFEKREVVTKSFIEIVASKNNFPVLVESNHLNQFFDFSQDRNTTSSLDNTKFDHRSPNIVDLNSLSMSLSVH